MLATLLAAYATAAIPARLCRGAEGDLPLAANLSLPSAATPWSSFPGQRPWRSLNARALARLRQETSARARTEIEQLQLACMTISWCGTKYWADQIRVQRLAAASMLSHAQGQDEEALAGVEQQAMT